MFMYKRLIESDRCDFQITIFEKKKQLGAGMPYSTTGANPEHVTNVSDNEIPPLVNSIEEWVQTAPTELLHNFDIDPKRFNEYKVLPRLLFGEYLSTQFELLQQQAKERNISTTFHLGTQVTDVCYKEDAKQAWVSAANQAIEKFDCVIICTGHHWPAKHEGIIPGYYDSPYPPAKLRLKLPHPVAIRGASLTAIDALRTLARQNGTFSEDKNGKLIFQLLKGSKGFEIVMHSRGGFLPGIRFHLDDPHLSKNSLLTNEQIAAHIKENNGFLSLDFIFEKDFKDVFRYKDAEFYERIKNMNLEDFVATMMDLRERIDPFQLFKAEYAEAEMSIKRKKSVQWKEALAILSFAMNYPAKHLSAEDMQRLQKVLMPLISIVIAFVPQNSCRELIALHEAGLINVVSVGTDSDVEVHEKGGITYTYTDESNQPRSVYYKTFIDCIGQPHLSYKQFPFKSLVEEKIISPAQLKFKSAETGKALLEQGNESVYYDNKDSYYLNVPGIAINDNFQVIDTYGAANNSIFMMAVPYMGGYNPDYSGLDFCEEATKRIIKTIIEKYPVK